MQRIPATTQAIPAHAPGKSGTAQEAAPARCAPCHEPPDRGWCEHCHPTAVLARQRAAFPFPVKVAGRVCG